MAPEVYNNMNLYGRKEYDPIKADSFSFGILIFAATFG